MNRKTCLMNIILVVVTYVFAVFLCLHSRQSILRWRREVHEWLKWRVGFRLFNYDSYKYLVVRNSFGYVAVGTGAILLAWFVPHISDKLSESISIGSTGGGVDIIPIAGMSMSGLAFCIGQIDRYVNRDTSLIGVLQVFRTN